MKRFLTFLCCLLIAVVSFAQSANQHLKFMGVPINGTITQFQTKLIAKGCTYDKITSSRSSNGSRYFNGTFVGNKVSIIAFYNTQTKIVYRVKAYIGGIAEDIADQKYNYIKNLLTQKYGSDYIREGDSDGKESVSMLVLKDNCHDVNIEDYTNVSDIALGTIDLFVTKDEEEWIRSPYNYNLHIDYIDAVNYEKNNNNLMNDL